MAEVVDVDLLQVAKLADIGASREDGDDADDDTIERRLFAAVDDEFGLPSLALRPAAAYDLAERERHQKGRTEDAVELRGRQLDVERRQVDEDILERYIDRRGHLVVCPSC